MACRPSMVLFGLAVASVSFLNVGVFAQNSTTTVAPSPTVTTAGVAPTASTAGVAGNMSSTAGGVIAPTPTTAVLVSSTAGSSEKFETKLMVSVEVEGCNSERKDNLTTGIAEIFKDSGYDFKNAEVSMPNINDKCVANITIKFGPNLSKTDILAKFEAAAKTGINGVEIAKLVKIHTKVEGVEIKYTPTDADCKAKCCDGGGGPITVTATCTPENKCANYVYNSTKTEPDCSKVCEDCSAAAMFTVSLMVLIGSGLMNWFTKE